MPDKEATARIKINRLLEAKGFPLIVLEAKAENKNPLVGKEQARTYARAQNCRFVILSNGNLHYFWDLERGNPCVVTSFPTPDSVIGYQKVMPEPPSAIPAIKTFFKACITSGRVRDIIDSRQFTDLATNPVFSTRDFKAVPEPYRALVPEYIKDYVSLNQFAA